MDEDKVISILRKNRPHIADSSINTYLSIIRTLYRKLGMKGDAKEWIEKNTDKVMAHMKLIPFNRRKTILACIVSLCGEGKCSDTYRSLMMKDIREYEEQEKKGEKTEKQKQNWVTQEELKTIYAQKAKDAKHLLSKKGGLSKNNLDDLQDFVILSLYTLIEPRRLLDYTEFKVRNIDPEKDNYMKGNTFIFNTYKTKKKYGRQVVKIPPLLNSIIRRWTALHNDDHLLFSSSNGSKLQQSQLTMRLNRILGRKASVNVLRHSFLTEKYKDMPMLEDMQQTANDMGHSVEQAMLYRKKE